MSGAAGTFRLLRGTHGRFEGPPGEEVDRLYRVGDLIELSEAEAERMGSRVEPVLSAEQAVKPELEPDRLPIRDAIGTVKAIRTAEGLEEFERAERSSGKARGLVIRAINERRAELAGEERG